MIAFARPDNVIAMPTKSNEWFTPARYIEAARAVMGGIDLDPASCKEANMVVRASKFYTQHDNGLTLPWYGRVWLNPPYSQVGRATGGLFRSTIEAFINKLIEEYRTGQVAQAILLVAARVNSIWFRSMWEYPICFPDHSILFYGKKTNPKNNLKHLWGSCFVYLGENIERFTDIFSQFGTIAKRVSTPRETVQPLSLWEVQQ